MTENSVWVVYDDKKYIYRDIGRGCGYSLIRRQYILWRGCKGAVSGVLCPVAAQILFMVMLFRVCCYGYPSPSAPEPIVTRQIINSECSL